MAEQQDTPSGRVERPSVKAARPLSGRWEELSPACTTLFIVGIYFFFNACYINCADFCPAPFRGCTPLKLREYLGQYCLPASAALSLTARERAVLWPGRLMWVFATTINLLAAVAAYFYCLYLIAKSRSDGGSYSPLRRYLPAGCALIALLFGVALTTDASWYMPQLEELLGCAAVFDLPDAVPITYFTLLVGTSAACLFVWASCVVIVGVEKTPAAVAQQMRTLRTLLYVAAASLVTTVLRLSMTFNWSLAALSSGSEGGRAAAVKLMESFASSFISVQAGAYSLILAAAYVPAAIVLSRRAGGLANLVNHESVSKREQWLKEQGLSDTFVEHLPRIAAILGPLLAGPLGGMLGKLVGGK